MSRGSRPSARDQRRPDQLAEQRVRPVRPALELGVGLGAHPEGVAGQLDELDQPAVGRVPEQRSPASSSTVWYRGFTS